MPLPMKVARSALSRPLPPGDGGPLFTLPGAC
jgi:hypothetical protein